MPYVYLKMLLVQPKLGLKRRAQLRGDILENPLDQWFPLLSGRVGLQPKVLPLGVLVEDRVRVDFPNYVH